MEKTLIIKKINQMPDQLMGIVSEFLDKLIQGYEMGVRTGSELSDEEKNELLDALAEYEAHPETGVKWESLKTELLEKNGI